ncbi:MAG: TIGR04282 family arsenosugar biosynthesis glycosyltransferase [Myxococcales bacterium]|nr:TIGR04282 family arsenosugar biosynthesis glycosyltransferase [Myxococcales bacterium]
MRPAILVFTRAPVEGEVKTRLAAKLGNREALRVFREMGAAIVASLCPADRAWSVFAVATPDGRREAIADWLPGLDGVWDQGSGDLGARLARATHGAFQQGFSPVVLVGTDCPAANASQVAEALRRLDAHDAVLGPALDGGYWLLALRRELPAVFERIAWSTPTVAEATRMRLSKAEATWSELGVWRDLDTYEDLLWWRKQSGFDWL